MRGWQDSHWLGWQGRREGFGSHCMQFSMWLHCQEGRVSAERQRDDDADLSDSRIPECTGLGEGAMHMASISPSAPLRGYSPFPLGQAGYSAGLAPFLPDSLTHDGRPLRGQLPYPHELVPCDAVDPKGADEDELFFHLLGFLQQKHCGRLPVDCV